MQRNELHLGARRLEEEARRLGGALLLRELRLCTARELLLEDLRVVGATPPLLCGRAAGDRQHVRRSARPLLARRTALLPQLRLIPLNPLVVYVVLGLSRALVLFVVADPLHAVFSLPTLSDTLATNALDLENDLATINQVALRGSIGTPAVLEL